jgi:hypothetical protein
MGQGNGCHGVDHPTANGQRLTGINGIHTGVDRQRNVNLLTGIAQDSPDPADQPGGGSSSIPHSGTTPAWEPACGSGTSRQTASASHHQATDGGAVKLEAVGNAVSAPQLEQARGNLNAVEAATNVGVQNFLTKDGPDHLSTGLNASGVGQPGFIV